MPYRFGRNDLDPGLESGDWPAWLPFAMCALGVVAVSIAMMQRLSGPQPGWMLAALALSVAPFLLDIVGYVTRLKVGLPLWFFPVPVLVGMTYLVLHPVSSDVAPFMLVFMSAEMIARTSEQRWIGVATLLASCFVVTLPDLAGLTHGFSVWVMAILSASGGGLFVQVLTNKTLQLRAAQAGLTEKAASDERSRIAREVHDVIAHSMSVTMLHITAARMALERDKTTDALDALREAEQQGRRSMGDIRRTVGLLGPNADATEAPMPTASDLPSLVRDFTGAGVPVSLQIDGDVSSLPPAAGLSIYRITQESLTNVAKHAPGAKASVTLSVDEDTMHLVVQNARSNGSFKAPEGSGLGIRGMVERAAVLEGTLSAGPSPDGWSVELNAPRPHE